MHLDRRDFLKTFPLLTFALVTGETKVSANDSDPISLFSPSCLNQDPHFLKIQKIGVDNRSSRSVYGWQSTWQIGEITDPNVINAIKNLRGRNFFISGAYSWDVPFEYIGFEHVSKQFVLYHSEGDQNPNYLHFYENVPGKENEVYTLIYSHDYYFNLHGDAKGNRVGVHPCAAVAIPRDQYNQIIASIKSLAPPPVIPTSVPPTPVKKRLKP